MYGVRFIEVRKRAKCLNEKEGREYSRPSFCCGDNPFLSPEEKIHHYLTTLRRFDAFIVKLPVDKT